MPRTRRRRSAPVETLTPSATLLPAALAGEVSALAQAPSVAPSAAANIDLRVFPTPALPHQPPAPAPRFRLGLTGVQLGMAVLSWGALVRVLYASSPATPAARVAFFVALFGGLFFTLAPVLRTLALRLSHSRIYHQAAGAHATRQAILLSLFVVLNALLLLVRAWSELNALLLFGTLAVMEVVALSRR
jgi:hypothetical protein